MVKKDNLLRRRKKHLVLFDFLARLKVASVWRRFLAEIIDFILLHALK
jgi:hypothetical protein